MSPNQRRAVIALIPKKGKEKQHIDNWRPISMLNVDYKILAKSLAKPLASLIHQVIHPNQTRFIPTIYIRNNIRKVQSLIDFTHVTSLWTHCLIRFFGHVWLGATQFPHEAVGIFPFGDPFLRWISVLHTDTESCVMNCGQSSGWFPFQKGIRQRCAISPFLFVMAVEKLADVIMANEKTLLFLLKIKTHC